MREDNGYTILETLVAMIILVLALSTVYQRIGIGTSTHDKSRMKIQVADVADTFIAELGKTRPLSYGTTEGDLSNGLHWRLSVVPTYPRPSGVQLPRLEGHSVALTLSRSYRGKRELARFDTVLIGAEQ